MSPRGDLSQLTPEVRPVPAVAQRRGAIVGFLSALAMLGPVAEGPRSLSAQTSDTVLVALGEETVEVRQRLVPSGGTVRAFAIRFDDQTLEVTEVVREGDSLLDATLRSGAHAYELGVSSGAPIIVRYTLRGALDRIPLFVAGGSAELTIARGVETPYLIRVEGGAASLAALDLPTSLPRLHPAEGAVEVALSSIPSIVRLSRRGGLSFLRVADALALLLVALGSLVALRRIALRVRDRAALRARDRAARRPSA